MGTTLRAVTDGEFESYIRTVQTAFGNQTIAEEVAGWRGVTELDRTLAAFDGDRMVATAGAFSFELSTPGAMKVAAAGVTAVGVLPTHRRRGLLTTLMERQLDDIARRGETVAMLTASESVIYGRFGYGAASFHRSIQIDPHHSRFADGGGEVGTIEVLDPVAVAETAPAVHNQARINQPGDVGRNDAWWALNIADPDWMRRGGPAKFWARHVSAAGKPDGYVAYRVTPAWRHGIAGAEVEVVALVGLDAAAELALWRFVLDLDLTGRVVAHSRPIDEALGWRLADPRQLLTTSVTDHIWVRLLDVAGALTSRGYEGDYEIVLDVEDGFRPKGGGRFALRTAGAEVECVRTRRAPDLTLGVAELGSAYLGHSRLAILAGAGRVVEHTTGSVNRADRLFGGTKIPFCRSGF